MKIAEIRPLSTEELYHELVRMRRHLFDLHTQAVTEKLEDPSQLGKTKRDIARILTMLHERGETGIEIKELKLERAGNR
jgi:large subunit ribosomal protein L29